MKFDVEEPCAAATWIWTEGSQVVKQVHRHWTCRKTCEQGIESDRVSACMKTISLSADRARKASPVCSSKFATGDVVTLVANLDPNSAGLELGPRGIGSASPAQASLETR